MKEANKVFGEYIDSYNTETEYNRAYKLLPHVSEVKGEIKYIPLGEFEKGLKIKAARNFNEVNPNLSISDWEQEIIDFDSYHMGPMLEATGNLVGKLKVNNNTYYLWKVNVPEGTLFEHSIGSTGWGLTTTMDIGDRNSVLLKDAPKMIILDDNKESTYNPSPAYVLDIWST